MSAIILTAVAVFLLIGAVVLGLLRNRKKSRTHKPPVQSAQGSSSGKLN